MFVSMNLVELIIGLILDHHCPWIGNCVGRRNRVTFILFLISTIIFLTLFTILNLERLHNGVSTGSKVSAIFFFFYIGLVGFFIFSLLFAQVFLIARGLTTLEYIRNHWKGMSNPYHQGCGRNFIDCCCEERCSQTISEEQINSRREIELGDTLTIDTSTQTASISEKLV